jgi:hypothetical protein
MRARDKGFCYLLAMARRKFVANDRISVELKLYADPPQPGFWMHVTGGLHPQYAHFNHRGLLCILERRDARHPRHNIHSPVPAEKM